MANKRTCSRTALCILAAFAGGAALWFLVLYIRQQVLSALAFMVFLALCAVA